MNAIETLRMASRYYDAALPVGSPAKEALADVEALLEAAKWPWTCTADCLAFKGYEHQVGCVDNLAAAVARVEGDTK